MGVTDLFQAEYDSENEDFIVHDDGDSDETFLATRKRKRTTTSNGSSKRSKRGRKKLLRCPEADCKFSTTDSRDLREHEEEHEDDALLVQCHQCSEKFNSEQILEKHLVKECEDSLRAR